MDKKYFISVKNKAYYRFSENCWADVQTNTSSEIHLSKTKDTLFLFILLFIFFFSEIAHKKVLQCHETLDWLNKPLFSDHLQIIDLHNYYFNRVQTHID